MLEQRCPTGAPRRPLAAALLATVLFAQAAATEAQTVDLYVDQATGQVFTQPAPGRTRLGTFQRIDTPEPGAGPAGPEAQGAAVDAPAPLPASTTAATVPPAPPPDDGDATVIAAVGKALKGKWYERLSLRGYTQFRYNPVLEKDGDGDWFVPADRSVNDNATFYIRRGRLILSGDVTDHLYLYIQPDLNASPSDGDFSLQMRDMYADVSIDKDKEFRFRVGQSKVPFGWVNMQSSQNRLALERPDGLNSAVESERDIGVFFYWAPKEIRDRFRDLVRQGLKGSGDYGVLGFGMYSGQGLNRSDANDSFHWIARAAYPFELPGGQIIEPSVEAYWGDFVTRTGSVTVDGETFTPSAKRSGIRDRRLGASLVYYPQPIGFEFEWNIGQGPELSPDFRRIESDFLHGGYAQVEYKFDADWGTFLPFIRWQYYEGGRKFARNAPEVHVDEWDFGLEWQPLPELELLTAYTYTPRRTNSSAPNYEDFTDASRLGLQLQWNY